MVVPALEEEAVAEETTPQPTEDSDSGKSYEASLDDMSVSAGDCEMYDPDFLNSRGGPTRASLN